MLVRVATGKCVFINETNTVHRHTGDVPPNECPIPVVVTVVAKSVRPAQCCPSGKKNFFPKKWPSVTNIHPYNFYAVVDAAGFPCGIGPGLA